MVQLRIILFIKAAANGGMIMYVSTTNQLNGGRSPREQFEEFTDTLQLDEYGNLCIGNLTVRALNGLNIVEAKRLHHLGLGIVLKAATPDLPYFDEPESPELRTLVAQTYIEADKFATDPGVTFDVTQQAARTLTKCVSPAIRKGLAKTDPKVIRSIQALSLLVPGSVSSWEIGQANERSIEEVGNLIEQKLKRTMFAGSAIVLEAISAQLLDTVSGQLGIEEYIRIKDKLRRILAIPRVGIMIYKMSGWDEHTLLTLQNPRTLLKGRLYLTDDSVVVNEDHMPDTANLPLHMPTNNVWDKAVARCPAQHVRGLIRWAPRALLTACDAVASEPPLPRINYRFW